MKLQHICKDDIVDYPFTPVYLEKSGCMLGWYTWNDSPGLWDDKAEFYPSFVWKEVKDE